jgi:hypothetical protein
MNPSSGSQECLLLSCTLLRKVGSFLLDVVVYVSSVSHCLSLSLALLLCVVVSSHLSCSLYISRARALSLYISLPHYSSRHKRSVCTATRGRSIDCTPFRRFKSSWMPSRVFLSSNSKNSPSNASHPSEHATTSPRKPPHHYLLSPRVLAKWPNSFVCTMNQPPVLSLCFVCFE